MNTATDFDPFQDKAVDLLETPAPYIGLTFSLDEYEVCISHIDEYFIYAVRLLVDNDRELIDV